VVQEVTTRGRDIIAELQAALRRRIGATRFDVWLAGVHFAIDGEVLYIDGPNRFTLETVRQRIGAEIAEAAREVIGRIAIEYRVSSGADSSGSAKTSSSSTATTASADEPAPSQVRQPANPGSVDGEPTGMRRRFESLESFVVGSSNSLAFKSAELAIEKPGNLSPLFIHGLTGVGKTHLLEGIYTAFRKQRQLSRFGAVPVYLTAEQFTSQFLEALHGSGLPLFRRKYRDVGLLLIDDVQFFIGKRATLTELLHTIDTLLGSGRQLVFAADRAPAALKALGPELTARFAGGMVCRIDSPDHDTRLQITRQLAKRFGMSISSSVAGYVASQFTSHARELSGALKRLQACSAAVEQPITVELAEQCLADLIQQHHQQVRLPDIEKAVCEVFGLQPDSLKSNRKGKEISYPRMLAMYLARKYTRTPLSEIGNFFGKRTHSTVISAQKKIAGLLAGGAPADGSLKADEAIRRVEEQLRAS
jgi:chromosomal replication initiator protein